MNISIKTLLNVAIDRTLGRLLGLSLEWILNEKGGCQEVTDTARLAELFNSFFKKKVDTLRQKTNQPPLVPPVSRLQKWLSTRSSPPPPFQLKEIDCLQFRRILKKFKLKRTHGLDWIDACSLKLAGPIVEASLIHLINLSIRQKRFAGRWKPQLIFPHFKKKERELMENYRPVSNLVQVGMMVEYAVCSLLSDSGAFCEKWSFPSKPSWIYCQPLHSNSTTPDVWYMVRGSRKTGVLSSLPIRSVSSLRFIVPPDFEEEIGTLQLQRRLHRVVDVIPGWKDTTGTGRVQN